MRATRPTPVAARARPPVARILGILLVAGLLSPSTAGLSRAARPDLGPGLARTEDLAQQPDERELREDLAELEQWRRRFEERGAIWLAETRGELRQRVRRLAGSQLDAGPLDEQRTACLLAVAAVLTQAEREALAVDPDSERGRELGLFGAQAIRRSGDEVRGLARRALADLAAASPQLAGELARRAAGSNGLTLEDRLAAIEILGMLRSETSLPALFTCGRDRAREIRAASLEALDGWRHERVQRFVARTLTHWTQDPEWIDPEPLIAHLEKAWTPENSAIKREVEQLARRGLQSQDWRQTLRTLHLLEGLRDDLVTAALVAGLETWLARGETEGRSRRVESALVDALRARTGTRIGAHPDRWRAYFASRASNGKPDPGEESAPATRSDGFYGLRPETDRVVFVLDVSGSMMQPSVEGQEQGPTRYAEAVAELLEFLRTLGPRTRFDVVVFSDRHASFSGVLVPANPERLDDLGRWLARQEIGGGTRLEPAVREVLHIQRDGKVDLKALQADTVIVLCDGETHEGPGWIAPLIRPLRELTQVRFHGVQIGGARDGALEQLAEQTGGRLVLR